MALPHFRNLTTATNNWEPIYQNLFEIVVSLPAVIDIDDSQRILLENATNIDLNYTPDIPTAKQVFKFSARRFPTTPTQTHVSFDITFNINQADSGAVDVWALLKRWYDLVWNSQTGEMHYKADMLGQITAHIHDRTGRVIRRGEMINTQILGISDWEHNWDDVTGILQPTASFVADYFLDTYYDAE